MNLQKHTHGPLTLTVSGLKQPLPAHQHKRASQNIYHNAEPQTDTTACNHLFAKKVSRLDTEWRGAAVLLCTVGDGVFMLITRIEAGAGAEL